MKKPLISVIMSVRNSEDTIRNSIESILNQSYKNFEFIIVNDFSSDSTLNILNEYKAKDKRIKIIQNKTKLGLTKSLNFAAKISVGKYLARQDDDDISHKDRFKKQIQYFKKKSELVLLGTWFNIIIGDQIIKKTFKDDHSYLIKRLYLSNPFCHASTIFSKKIFDKLGGYNEKYTYSQDLDLWLKFASSGKIGLVEEVLVDRYTSNKKINYKKSWQQVFNSLLIRFFNKRLTNLPTYFFYSLIGFSYHFLITILPNKFINLLKIFLSNFDKNNKISKIDVLYVISDFSNIGGTEKHISLIINQLIISTNKNYKLFILRNYSKKLSSKLKLSEKYIIKPPFINNYLKGFLFSHYMKALFGGIKLFFYCLTNNIRIVHLHLPTATFVGAIFLYLFNMKIIASRRSLNNYLDNYYPIIRSLEKHLFNRCKYIIGNSKAVVQQLVSEVADQNKVKLITSGTHNFNLEKKYLIRDKIRQNLNIDNDTILIIKVANLIDYKGHDLLLNALIKVKKSKKIKWKLLLLGKDFGTKIHIEKIIQNNNLNENIIFLNNVTNPKDYFFASDFNILTSYQEGFSNSIIESMSAGLPNIVTNVGGNKEAVIDNINGYVINNFNIADIANKIIKLSTNKKLMIKFSNNSRNIFLDKFTLENCINNYKKIYDIK